MAPYKTQDQETAWNNGNRSVQSLGCGGGGAGLYGGGPEFLALAHSREQRLSLVLVSLKGPLRSQPPAWVYLLSFLGWKRNKSITVS
jgi:hypothetical protein